jgi:hypothetical protein
VRVPLAVDVDATKNLLRDALALSLLPRSAAPRAQLLDVCEPRCASSRAREEVAANSQLASPNANTCRAQRRGCDEELTTRWSRHPVCV